MSTITAEACAEVLFKHWVCRFGIPETIISDQGRQFEAHVFKKVLEFLGITKHRTTSYHPQSNGMVERCHRTMKDSLR